VTWRDDLRRVRMTIDGRSVELVGASFRGVPFLVDTSERSGGRRTLVHEFPLRDDPFVEDLGRRARKFPITGYVIGGDYLAQRDKLLAALEDEEGPGKLVHLYYGEKRAICDTYSVHEASNEGGMARFAITFCETPAQAPAPAIEVDAAGAVASSADNALLAVDAELVEKMDPAGQPAFALASAETALRNAAAGLAAKLAPAAQAAAQVAGGTAEFAAAVTQELAAMTGQVALITAQAASLVRRPADIVTAFRAAITALGDTAAAAPGAVMDALVAAYATDLGPPAPTTTATRERELANQQALTGALRRVMALEAARLAPLVPYASIEDAIAARDEIAALLDDQAQGAGDTAYPALVTLRSEVLRAVPGANVFARVITVSRRVATPSLLLVYQLYGSVDLELDVIARNRIAHPGFIAGDLKVLSAAAP
jgi:prophage DNA circulation protein